MIHVNESYKILIENQEPDAVLMPFLYRMSGKNIIALEIPPPPLTCYFIVRYRVTCLLNNTTREGFSTHEFLALGQDHLNNRLLMERDGILVSFVPSPPKKKTLNYLESFLL